MNVRDFILQMADSTENTQPNHINPAELALIYNKKYGNTSPQVIFEECENLVQAGLLKRKNPTPDNNQLNNNMYFK